MTTWVSPATGYTTELGARLIGKALQRFPPTIATNPPFATLLPTVNIAPISCEHCSYFVTLDISLFPPEICHNARSLCQGGTLHPLRREPTMLWTIFVILLV